MDNINIIRAANGFIIESNNANIKVKSIDNLIDELKSYKANNLMTNEERIILKHGRFKRAINKVEVTDDK